MDTSPAASVNESPVEIITGPEDAAEVEPLDRVIVPLDSFEDDDTEVIDTLDWPITDAVAPSIITPSFETTKEPPSKPADNEILPGVPDTEAPVDIEIEPEAPFATVPDAIKMSPDPDVALDDSIETEPD
jgi:hypothetical protein